MRFHERGFFNIRSSSLNSASLALLTAGVFAFSAAQALKTVQSTSDLRFNPSSISWWSSLNLRLEKKELLPLAALPELQIAHQKSLVPRTFSKAGKARHFTQRLAHVPAPTQFAETEKAIETRSSAPLAAPAVIALASQLIQPADEMVRMQAIHQALRGQFRLAMEGKLPSAIAKMAIAGTTIDQNAVLNMQRVSAKDAVVTPGPKVAGYSLQSPPPSSSQKSPREPVTTQIKVALTQSLATSTDQAGFFPGLHETLSASKAMPTTLPAGPLHQEISQVTSGGNRLDSLNSHSASSVAPAEDVRSIQRSEISESQAETEKYDQILGVPSLPAHPRVYGLGSPLLGLGQTVLKVAVNTQTVASHQPPLVNSQKRLIPSEAVQNLKSLESALGIKSKALVSEYSAAAPLRESVIAVEAFAWKTPVDAKAEVFSFEGIAKESTHQWGLTRAIGYWPTLAFQALEGHRVVPALLSNNSALLLAARSGARLQSDAGIVFGFVAGNQSIQFSGRSEKVLYFDGPNGNRAFAFVNAAPGAHILYLADGAALAIPVLDGKATFLDLTQVRRRGYTGRVFDAGSRSARPLKSVIVKVAGYPGASGLTDSQGYFSLENVPSFGDYPLYFETTTGTEFKHRYRIDPSQPRSVTLNLFRFSAEKLNFWLSQLEGGVSPDSGLVISAFPKVAASQDRGSLHIKIRPVLKGAALPPETYILNSNEQLSEVNSPNSRSTRAISVQVPEGLNIAQVLHSANGKVLWSELVIASPGVVNVVGPY